MVVNLNLVFQRLRIAAYLLIVVAVYFLWSHVMAPRWSVSKAQKFMAAGFVDLAVEELRPHWRVLSQQNSSCLVMFGVFSKGGASELLNLSAQACLSSGVDLVDSWLALAAAQEMRGNKSRAAQVLKRAMEQHQTEPRIYFQLATTLVADQKPQEAGQIFRMGLDKLPDNLELSFQAMQFHASLQDWAEASRIAQKYLDPMRIENPEMLLSVARILKRAGAFVDIAFIVNRAMERVPEATHPEVKNRFPELFSGMNSNGTNSNKGESKTSQIKSIQPSSALKSN